MNTLIYKIEYNLSQETISEQINNIAMLLKKNGYILNDKKILKLEDLEEEGLDNSWGNIKTSNKAKYIFVNNKNIKLELSSFFIKLYLLNDVKVNIINEYKVLSELISLIKGLNIYRDPFFRISIINYNYTIIKKIRDIKKLAKKENLKNKYVKFSYEHNLELTNEISTILDNYYLYIKNNINTGLFENKNAFLFEKKVIIYNNINNGSIYEDKHINLDNEFFNNMTNKLMELVS